MERCAAALSPFCASSKALNNNQTLQINTNEETPVASNLTGMNSDKNVTIESLPPRSIDVSSCSLAKNTTSKKVNTEDAYNHMFELGYNSNSKLTYYGDTEFEFALMEEYNEGKYPSTEQEGGPPSVLTGTTAASIPEEEQSRRDFILITDDQIKKRKW